MEIVAILVLAGLLGYVAWFFHKRVGELEDRVDEQDRRIGFFEYNMERPPTEDEAVPYEVPVGDHVDVSHPVMNPWATETK